MFTVISLDHMMMIVLGAVLSHDKQALNSNCVQQPAVHIQAFDWCLA